ncbi:MAG TPA: DUF58 domain-containing protein [Phycisphaerales bacterium]|nr:DUF58 domain-containing protein [Phycisphaerales bacterium]
MTPAELARQVKLLQISTRHLVTEVFAGEYSSAFKGRGIEFAEVREYEPGDDVRTIDWNVTARTGRPFVKRFTEERELTVVLAVDCSASNFFSSTRDGRTKQQLAAEIAALVAFAAAKKGDRVGLLLFSDRVERFVPPAKGSRHAMRIIREVLACVEASGEHRGTDLRMAAERLALVLRRRSVVFFVSDFLDGDPGDALSVLTRRSGGGGHDVIALDISDPREFEFPAVGAGVLTLRDPESGEVVEVDTSSPRVRAAYAASARAWIDAKDRSLARLGIDRVRLSTDRPFVHDLAAFFIRREQRR